MEELLYAFFSLRKLCTVVPQTEQVPFMACLPFFMVTSFASFISLFCLHFTQYASAIFHSFHRKTKNFTSVARAASLFDVSTSAFIISYTCSSTRRDTLYLFTHPFGSLRLNVKTSTCIWESQLHPTMALPSTAGSA